MQTPVSLLAVEVNAAPAKTAKQSNNPPSAMPFHQVLSKEVSNKAAAPSKPQQKNSAQANEAKQVEAPSKDTTASGDALAPHKASKSASEEDNDTASTDGTNAANSADNAQLIALVANINQLATSHSKTGNDVTAQASDVEHSGLAAIGDQTRGSGKDDKKDVKLDAAGQTELTSDEQKIGDKPGPASDFAATLQDAKKDSKDVAQFTSNNTAHAANDKEIKADPLVSDASNQVATQSTDKLAASAQKVEGIQNNADVKNQALSKLTENNVTPNVQNFAQQLAVSNRQLSAASAMPADNHLAPPVGSSGWDQAVGQKVVWMVAGGQQTAELTLNPPDLGPMQIVLSVNNDQANATFTSAQPEVREALESAMPKLRQMMSEAGVQLSGFSVNSQAANQNSNAFADRSPQTPRNGASTSSSEMDTAATRTGSTIIRRNVLGAVDTFA